MLDTIVGLLGIVVWIVVVVAFAAAVTYLVIKISPVDKPPKHPPAEPEPEA
jgi:hypothetical protein